MKKSNLSKAKLRQQAEEKIGQQKTAATPVTEADTTRLLHELQVHQIELEMQNEELEQARVESEAVHRQYTDLYDFAPMGYFTMGRDGAISRVNLAGANLLGVERGKLIKLRLSVFVPAQSLETLNAFLDQVFTSGKNEVCEIELLKAGSAPLWAHIESATDSSEHETCRVVVVDITERKLAEEALRESNELLSLFMKQSPIYTFIKAVTPSKSRILYVSDNFQDMIGIPASEMVGKTNEDLFPAEFAAKITADDRAIVANGVGLRQDEDLNGRNYTTIKFPIVQGDRTLLAGYTIDITERKKAEQKLLAYSEHLEEMVEERTRELSDAQEKLIRQEKLAVLGQLAGGVGHELRNPLGVINTSIYYLKLVQPEAGGKIKRHLDMIEQEVHNAEKIIADLLDFARVISADREPASVPELVRGVLARYPVPSAVKVALKLPANLPMVFADPRQVEQVLGNLITNAYQAMEAGGKLTISGHVVVPVTARDRQKQMLAIAVKDTGGGILPENMKKLFEPLFTTKAKGIGLGLAVSKKLAEANGGRIEVESTSGKGSTFTLVLPVSME